MTAGTPAVLPSLEPPSGIELRIGRVVAAMFLRAHTPAETPGRCGRCRLPWPCLSVRWADDFLNAIVSPPGGSDPPGNRDTEPIPRT